MKFRVSIGMKLAITAVVGMALVAAMLGNQFVSDSKIRELGADVTARQTVSQSILEAELELRRAIIQSRTVRSSFKLDEIDTLMKAFESYGSNAQERLDNASKHALNPQVLADLAKAKELYASYIAGSRQLAEAQKETVTLRERLSREGLSWPTQMAQISDGGALAGSMNRAEVVRHFEVADSDFKQARLVGWVMQARADDTLPGRMNAAFESALSHLKAARAIAEAPSIKADIDKLPPFITQYRALVGQLNDANARVVTTIRDKVDPVRAKADEITETVKKNVAERVAGAQAAAAAEAKSAQYVSWGFGAAILLVLAGSAVFSRLSIARPIQRIGDVLLDLSRGNKDVEIPYVKRGDEVGDAARAAQVFRDNLARVEKMETEQRALEQRGVHDRKQAMHKLADEFELAVGNIVRTVSSASAELEASAGGLTRSADMTQQLSATVAAASEQASANVQSVASAAEEMAASVTEIGRQMQASHALASEAVGQTETTNARMARLSHAANSIGNVVQLITAIAEQTNLLALNATIEAARAGESGKGFAVVAQEVKALAAQTAKATQDIGAQVAGMQAETRDSVAAIQEISGTIARISEIASSIAAAVEQQNATTQDIARNIQQASAGTTQVARNISDVTREASETGSASAQVLAAAQSLSSESSHLTLEMGKFLDSVRAA